MEVNIIFSVAHQVDSISLVDVSDKLPNLKRNPGLTTWKVILFLPDL
jgi:hypothetical protein